ncbi:NAD(P)-dependent oxidoreductase [Streptomyces hoynatensis]|uniref:NAD-dependent epimerase/dehydratase family protein n=1 Tax=Streptomyces hoynatensis TaxID=1141874 RepID=A0A3A9YYM3_9ACTN|nr:NAD(P)H-binding protein [Streptomyces hoynatensis]RKN41181.1 NAD-dependent epimerase/dehydratase family protein [Streptomyces hoynatensis]
MRIAVFGATGYAGRHLVNEALARGHEVVGLARKTDALAGRQGLVPLAGSVHDAAFVRQVAADADVLALAVPGKKGDEGVELADSVPEIGAAAAAGGCRLGVVGGAGSLHVTEGGPLLLDSPGFPDFVKPEATSHLRALTALRELPAAVDWFYLSPAAFFGAHAPGSRTGEYRVGGEVLVSRNGMSTIGGEDYAIAFLDEIERPRHRRRRFTVGY